MNDIMLDNSGDIAVTQTGDICLTKSIRQAIKIRLQWIYQEWRLGPEFGFRWFEEMFVKNPDTDLIRQLVRDEIIGVDGVTGAEVSLISYDREKRSATFAYTCTVGEETFKEEVTLYG